MNSKERVRTTLTRRGIPDRIPVQFDLCRSLIQHFARELSLGPEYALSYYEDLTYRISANAIRTALGSDAVVVGGTVASDFTPVPVQGDVTANEFGMHMKPTALYVEVVDCPLKDAGTPDDIERYNFPDPYAFGRFDIARSEIERFGNDYFVIGDCELSIFELAWHLTGMEKYMVALALGEDWVDALNDRVEYWTTHIALQQVDLGVDALWFGEDLGTQTATLISPDMWRERFKYRYVRMFETVKKKNPDVIVIMHSDGAVAPLLDDFIEIGIDVYNPVQPNVPGSDPEELKNRYGDRLSFFGGIDQQVLLPGGDAVAIRKEIRYRCEVLGRNGGWLMAPAHIIQADVAPGTVKLIIEAAKEFGTHS